VNWQGCSFIASRSFYISIRSDVEAISRGTRRSVRSVPHVRASSDSRQITGTRRPTLGLQLAGNGYRRGWHLAVGLAMRAAEGLAETADIANGPYPNPGRSPRARAQPLEFPATA
jgi:hypothetical protein